MDRTLAVALVLCALGLVVAGVAATRPAPSAVTVLAAKERPGPLSRTGPSR